MEEEVQQGKKKEARVNPVVDNLEMEWEETLVCERCGVRTVRRKKEVGLFCSLNQEDSSPTDLRQLIESSVEPEMVERNCEEKGCKHNQARQSRRLTAMPRVLLIYLKRMAWDKVNKESGGEQGKNIKVTKVVNIPAVVSLAPIKAPDCSLPPAQPMSISSSSSNQVIILPSVINLLSPVKKVPPSAMATPPKFSGKTMDQLAAMSETDQEEYVTFKSTRESFSADQNLTEEEQLKAALEA